MYPITEDSKEKELYAIKNTPYNNKNNINRIRKHTCTHKTKTPIHNSKEKGLFSSKWERNEEDYKTL
jgi:hypothetical protein